MLAAFFSASLEGLFPTSTSSSVSYHIAMGAPSTLAVMETMGDYPLCLSPLQRTGQVVGRRA